MAKYKFSRSGKNYLSMTRSIARVAGRTPEPGNSGWFIGDAIEQLQGVVTRGPVRSKRGGYGLPRPGDGRP